jgi:hypothetical protein
VKTHELAKFMRQLAAALEAGPNLDLKQFRVADAKSIFQSSSGVAVNLSTLAELSRIDRAEWVALINDYGFDIPIRPRDASRDILGKLLSYLEENEDARNRLKSRVMRRGESASPDLMRALGALLGEDH